MSGGASPTPGTPRFDRAWIAAHIPHAGAMCLLDAVLAWDATTILCSADSHRGADHPLRAGARLGAACGVEYAAQAMAVHGALRAGPGSGSAALRAGALASVRGLELYTARLDTVAGPLAIMAERLGADAHAALYRFEVRAGDDCLLVRARVSLVFDAALPDGARP